MLPVFRNDALRQHSEFVLTHAGDGVNLIVNAAVREVECEAAQIALHRIHMIPGTDCNLRMLPISGGALPITIGIVHETRCDPQGPLLSGPAAIQDKVDPALVPRFPEGSEVQIPSGSGEAAAHGPQPSLAPRG